MMYGPEEVSLRDSAVYSTSLTVTGSGSIILSYGSATPGEQATGANWSVMWWVVGSDKAQLIDSKSMGECEYRSVSKLIKYFNSIGRGKQFEKYLISNNFMKMNLFFQ